MNVAFLIFQLFPFRLCYTVLAFPVYTVLPLWAWRSWTSAWRSGPELGCHHVVMAPCPGKAKLGNHHPVTMTTIYKFGRPVEVHEEVRRGRGTLPWAPCGLWLAACRACPLRCVGECSESENLALPGRWRPPAMMEKITKRPWIPWWAWRKFPRTPCFAAA